MAPAAEAAAAFSAKAEKATVPAAAVAATSATVEPVAPAETETVYRLCFECQITMQQAKELSAWLKARNISFRRV